jgi:hypothetical protein
VSIEHTPLDIREDVRLPIQYRCNATVSPLASSISYQCPLPVLCKKSRACCGSSIQHEPVQYRGHTPVVLCSGETSMVSYQNTGYCTMLPNLQPVKSQNLFNTRLRTLGAIFKVNVLVAGTLLRQVAQS